MIEKLGPIATVPVDERIAFNFPPPEAARSPIETLDGLGRLQRRPLVLASSTCGSTWTTASRCSARTATASRPFIRLLSDRRSRARARSAHAAPAYRLLLADQEESLDYEATPFQHMSSALGPAAGETKVRAS